jgi:hypothetical protein
MVAMSCHLLNSLGLESLTQTYHSPTLHATWNQMIQCRDTPHVANCLLSAQKIRCHLLNNIELLHLLLHLHNVHAACLQCGNTAIPALSITKKKSQVHRNRPWYYHSMHDQHRQWVPYVVFLICLVKRTLKGVWCWTQSYEMNPNLPMHDIIPPRPLVHITICIIECTSSMSVALLPLPFIKASICIC